MLPNKIIDQPWQSCSCIGGWHYNTSIYEKNEYKSAAYVAKLLVDIVSKNEICCWAYLCVQMELSMNEEKILNEFGAWMNINKGSYLWYSSVGSVRGRSDCGGRYSAQCSGIQWRFLQSGRSKGNPFHTDSKYLYATVLAWPADGKVNIKSLAADSKLYEGKIRKVELLGYGKVDLSVPPKACRLRFLYSRWIRLLPYCESWNNKMW